MNMKIAALAAALALAAPAAMAGEQCHMRSHKAQKDHSCAPCEYADAMHKMHKGMSIHYTGDTDLDFVNGMIPHHQGAVAMAQTVLKYGKDPEIRGLAQWIVQAQETEIGFMESWRRGRVNADAPRLQTPQVEAYKKAMESMHHAMTIDYTGNADVDFARGMIPHHQGAIDMALVELKSGKNREIHKLASDIINSQQQEIGVMKRWLAEHEAALPPKKKTKKTSKKKSQHGNHASH